MEEEEEEARKTNKKRQVKEHSHFSCSSPEVISVQTVVTGESKLPLAN